MYLDTFLGGGKIECSRDLNLTAATPAIELP